MLGTVLLILALLLSGCGVTSSAALPAHSTDMDVCVVPMSPELASACETSCHCHCGDTLDVNDRGNIIIFSMIESHRCFYDITINDSENIRYLLKCFFNFHTHCRP